MESTINFSVNGFRTLLSEDLVGLRDIVQDILNDNEIDKEALLDLTNSLICLSNGFNCVSIEGMKLFSDMSDREISLIEEQE